MFNFVVFGTNLENDRTLLKSILTNVHTKIMYCSGGPGGAHKLKKNGAADILIWLELGKYEK